MRADCMPRPWPPAVEELDVEAAAYRWWLGHRPLEFTEADHLANPTVNTCTDREKVLARAVAASLPPTTQPVMP